MGLGSDLKAFGEGSASRLTWCSVFETWMEGLSSVLSVGQRPCLGLVTGPPLAHSTAASSRARQRQGKEGGPARPKQEPSVSHSDTPSPCHLLFTGSKPQAAHTPGKDHWRGAHGRWTTGAAAGLPAQVKSLLVSLSAR